MTQCHTIFEDLAENRVIKTECDKVKGGKNPLAHTLFNIQQKRLQNKPQVNLKN